MRDTHQISRSAIAFALLAAAATFSSTANAKSVVISGRHSASEIQGKCNKTGGHHFYSNGATGEYGCLSDTGAGGDVACKKGKCYGSVPLLGTGDGDNTGGGPRDGNSSVGGPGAI